MNLSKENIVSHLLNVSDPLSDTSHRDMAIDYFMHDSDGVCLAFFSPSSTTLKSDGGTSFPSPLNMQYVRQSAIIIKLIIMY